jgi:hypothetical protein
VAPESVASGGVYYSTIAEVNVNARCTFLPSNQPPLATALQKAM